MARIIETAESLGIRLANGSGDVGSRPVVSESKIAFNGLGDERKEAFAWPPEFERRFDHTGKYFWHRDEEGFHHESTKTNWQPYDTVVMACLLAAKRHLGDDIRLGSDYDREWWRRGETLYRAALHEEPPALAWEKEGGSWFLSEIPMESL